MWEGAPYPMSVRKKILLSALIVLAVVACAAVAAGIFVGRALEQERARDEAESRAR